jgi:hypothetical protein
MLKVFIEERCVKIPWSGCWIWEGATCNGYGSFRDKWKGPTKYAHRTSYETFKEKIPNGLWVLHTCDIRYCCNPDHLFLGTRQDNIKDAMQKGRLKGITRNRPSGLTYKKRNT